ncbi:CDP-diacylglycerol--glycerol-3-phosphate 3-phosphatidyltransferase [Gordonia pseudamarae]|jgi:CDP-diacylglycerol--glycerol-3-phosphate 3-phosphatidyltransferase|uniref:CDP-diacylglycerol--glycerol-3-phosphate 3-phosphatidyltransferase n=1 Tax=Gordonia pseudamarae TaxID=2831662 RepID=A0ABX6IHG3_9ACTN|nr:MULTISPECIES: CDP-diacylglycerol--glycerol-3-phosphate 3-phosphatidyltransferase [Gordonia]MBD0020938.1 CDP-diacylglycerol--glycerol-3-phosphate 3-phosphatidyltransferase [Gordonia sp. (in: high G+C Gram-positive bacteria)]QHN26209.1 CDP-diacylglycerol--glycerol-3-phosphate 3-phosphatidyltransferase [Gordonia pseudamarae]QHN35102.1 CDP-diacylglycerol--glycerol-3-phosphate 3-phosphatidyltransferase [Gordonia pseudamarae]
MTDRVRRALDEEAPDTVDDPIGVAAGAGDDRSAGDRFRDDLAGGDRAGEGPHEVPLLNIANVLTVFRILLVPVFVAALFVDDGDSTAWRIVATVIFAIAALTDRYDGRLARERGLITEFGKLADPIADKALIGTALVGLSVLGEVSWWITGIILVRELGVTALRFWVLRHGVIPASRGGKLKTLLQSLAIGFYLLPLDGAWHLIAVVLMWAAVVVTVVTAADYIWQAVALRAKGRAARSR